MRNLAFRSTSPVLVCALALAASTARAQPADARAELFAQAEAAHRAGRNADALGIAMRAADLGMTPALRLFIAVQHEALGHLLDARSSADRCVHEAGSAPATLALRSTILARCQQMVSALDTRLAQVVVRVPEPRPRGFRVQVQGAELDPSQWNAPVSVLPGAVRVEAWLGDAAPDRRELRLAAGAREEVRFAAPAPPPPPPPRPHTTVAPWIVAGAGLVALGVGAALIALRDDQVDTRDGLCPMEACPNETVRAQGQSHDDSARALQSGAYVAFGVGAAALVGGAVWWIVARNTAAPSAARAAPWVHATAQGAALGIAGAF